MSAFKIGDRVRLSSDTVDIMTKYYLCYFLNKEKIANDLRGIVQSVSPAFYWKGTEVVSSFDYEIKWYSFYATQLPNKFIERLDRKWHEDDLMPTLSGFEISSLVFVMV